MNDVISHFRFESYKIDTIAYETIPEVNFLAITDTLAPKGWQLEIAIRQPLFLKKDKKYIGGMDISLKYPIPKEALDSIEKQETSSKHFTDLVKLAVGIAGIFSVEEGRFPQETEKNLVKIQIPMLLFSYLRSAITSIMAHAGLGSFIFPLINIHELAKKADLTIEEIESNTEPSLPK